MRLLIIEDDPDGREMLAELFRMRDWDVTAVSTVDGAMKALRTCRFDVVISDEDIQGKSGSSMVCQASADGLLRDVGVIMYTAEPGGIQVPPGVRVLRKPLGVTKLLDEARAALIDAAAEAAPSSRARPRRRHSGIVVIGSSGPRIQERDGAHSTRMNTPESPPSSRAR